MRLNSTNEKLFFYNLPSILFSLIPLFLITGPLLSDFAISMISLIFLIYCTKERNFSYFKNKYFYLFLIFWGYLIFNSLINNFNLGSMKITMFYFRYGVFVIAIITILNLDDKYIKYFFYCTLICFIILILDGFFQYFNGKNIFGFETENPSRVSSFFHEDQILGSYLSRLWPILFALFTIFLKEKNRFYYFFVVIFILSQSLIFLSGDRAAFFSIILSSLFIILLSKHLMKLKVLILISNLFLILSVGLINPTAHKRVLNESLKEMNILKHKNNDQIYIFSKTHNEIYISAYKMFLDNKIIGVGVKNFRNICKNPKYHVNSKEICFTHPHNTYLQILTETGILGFFFLLTCLLYFCKNIFSHILNKFRGKYLFNDFEICILSGIAIYLWPLVPTGNIFSNWINIALIINLPFLIWSRKLSSVKK